MPGQKLEKGQINLLKIIKMDAEIPQNNSHQELVRAAEGTDYSDEHERTIRDVTLKEWIIVFILCFVNLINYMDRFTLAGILEDIQTYFNIGDDLTGLLQTVFILSYMVFAPLFGYLGDRYSRKIIMAGGVFLWSMTTLLGSFMTNFWWFMFFRALVGIGEASYSTIAPTIISDLFVGGVRSKMLAVFYFAIPVGSGLGYIVGSETAKALGAWQWGLRVTPALGVVAVLLMLFVLVDPERGQSEGSEHLEPTPWQEDIKDLAHNGSFIFSTAGFTCVAFVAGALAWWGPKFIYMGISLQPGEANTTLNSISYKFGIIAMTAGIMGVPLGSFMAQRLRHKFPSIDPQICAYGLLVSGPLVFFSLITSPYSTSLCMFFVFCAQLSLNLTWSIVADILLYTGPMLDHNRRPSMHRNRKNLELAAIALSDHYIYYLASRLFFIILSLSFVFGTITMTAGITGLALGCILSQALRKKFHTSDPIICGVGLLISAPLLIGTTYAATYNSPLCFVLLFFGQVALNLNWAIVSDILLYVVIPTRRSTAEGVQLLVSHAFGDAGSPFLIGVISEALKITLSPAGSTEPSDEVNFRSLQYALFTTCFVEIIGGFFFLLTTFYIAKDKKHVEKVIHGHSQLQIQNEVTTENETSSLVS